MNVKKLLAASLTLLAILLVSSCSSPEDEKTITTTIYPVQYALSQIVGDDYKVKNITPVGVEPHDLELTPETTEEILTSDLAILVGNGFQPSIEKTASNRDSNTFEVLDHVELSVKSDPHFWLDPKAYEDFVNKVTDELIELNPESEAKYESNRDKFNAKLNSLTEKYASELSSCKTKTFITAHDAFVQLAKRYGLTNESIAGVSPENEPSASKLVELRKLAEKENINTIFTEELVSDKVAKSLSKDAGLRTEVLSPIEGLTEDNQKEDYFSIMDSNLQAPSRAMGCSSDA